MYALSCLLSHRRRPVRPSRLVNRNVIAERGRTSIRFEPELWDSLQEICRREQIGGLTGGRTSAVRVDVVSYFRDAATEEGHRRAGHGLGVPPDRDWKE